MSIEASAGSASAASCIMCGNRGCATTGARSNSKVRGLVQADIRHGGQSRRERGA